MLKYPQTYCILWFIKENEVLMSSKCLVNFLKWIKEFVWCDMVPTDACHFLLGRPWQFDRKTIHHGDKNTYSFYLGKEEGVEINERSGGCQEIR